MENKEKIDVLAKVLAAASIIANSSDPELQKLGDVIGDSVAKLVPEIEGVDTNEFTAMVFAHGQKLISEMPQDRVQETPRIQLIN